MPTFDSTDVGTREAWSELTGQAVDEKLHLIPPVYSDLLPVGYLARAASASGSGS
ncbi:hypothetical protein [Lentzea sp. NEAU-D7]|uniref:hypothetical protein n=1 Tax=Lentzea sp. NEAU-D7 TaxID=2994667 RepID=UPI00224B0202|nr:hypothetical protein [Lentzea sp. NEAU-D7]MCX2952620.1 hypothetical protein [Lentzea sp. NEAU-D7]